jgi:hypothetical protein
MSSVEERLARLEHEMAEIKRERSERKNPRSWVFCRNTQFQGDSDLKEIFQLAKQLRDEQRTEELR